MKSYSLPTIKQLPFRSHLLAKLLLILREYGSRNKAAKKMGINRCQFSRWLRESGDPKCGPCWLAPKSAELIDGHYAICWEKREIRARKERNRVALKEAVGVNIIATWKEPADHAANEWNQEAIRQAPSGVPMSFEPPAHALRSK